MARRPISALVLLALVALGCTPQAPLFSNDLTQGIPGLGAPTTVTHSGTLFGRGFHRGNCNNIGNTFQPRFTSSRAGQADLTLRFDPIAGQELSLDLDPAPTSGRVVQGAGPLLQASFGVAAATDYVVRICVPVGPGLDPGPFRANLTVTHP